MKENTYKLENVGEFYDAFVYEQLDSGVNHRHLRILEYLEGVGLSKAKRILEIGCGIGTQTGLILGFVSSKCKVTAIDISPKSIEVAKTRLSRHKNVEFFAGDIIDIKLEGRYDLVVLPDVLEHIPLDQHLDLFLKLEKVISESGKIAINIPHPHFLEYLIKNYPDQLQVIDNPINLNRLSKILDRCGLIINHLSSYSVYYRPVDYQFIVVDRINSEFNVVENPQGDSFVRRIKRWTISKIKSL